MQKEKLKVEFGDCEPEKLTFGDRVTIHTDGRPDRYGIFLNELSGGLVAIRFHTKRTILELPKITKGWPEKTETESPAELAFGDPLFYENEAVLFIRLNPQEKREAVICSRKKMFYAPVKYLIRPDDMPLANFEPETVRRYDTNNFTPKSDGVLANLYFSASPPSGDIVFDKAEDEAKAELTAEKKTCVPCEIPESSDGVISHGLRKNNEGEFVPDYAGIVDRLSGYSSIIESDVQAELNLPYTTKRLRRLTNALSLMDKAIEKVRKLKAME